MGLDSSQVGLDILLSPLHSSHLSSTHRSHGCLEWHAREPEHHRYVAATGREISHVIHALQLLCTLCWPACCQSALNLHFRLAIVNMNGYEALCVQCRELLVTCAFHRLSAQKQTSSKKCMTVKPTPAHHAVDVALHHGMSVRIKDWAAMSHSLACNCVCQSDTPADCLHYTPR